MFRIQHLLLITVAALCSCATERTVATNFQPRQRPDSEKTDAELMDALEAKFAGGFGQQTDKEGNTGWCPKNGVPLKGSGTAATRLKSKKRLLKPHPLKKRNLTVPPPGLKRRNGTASNPSRMINWKHRTSSPGARGVNTHSWQDASKQYATQQSDFHGRSWKNADKRLGRTVNRDIEAKRQSFGQPTIMSARQAQAHTIQETREMMGRTD